MVDKSRKLTPRAIRQWYTNRMVREVELLLLEAERHSTPPTPLKARRIIPSGIASVRSLSVQRLPAPQGHTPVRRDRAGYRSPPACDAGASAELLSTPWFHPGTLT